MIKARPVRSGLENGRMRENMGPGREVVKPDTTIQRYAPFVNPVNCVKKHHQARLTPLPGLAGRVMSLDMSLNLLKTAAGLQEIDQLIARQANNKFVYNGKKVTWAYTRYAPKRADEIIESGGSIYWILKNRIQVRQKILGFEMAQDESDTWCKIVVEPQLWRTYSQQKRAIQGWRYLEGKGVPADRRLYITGENEDDMPEEMAVELKKLGLL